MLGDRHVDDPSTVVPEPDEDTEQPERDRRYATPLCGAPRIHGELQKLGIAVSQSAVADDLWRHSRPPSQTWTPPLTKRRVPCT